MIADVYKFIEHVHKIQIIPVARALFLLYFPSKLHFLGSVKHSPIIGFYF